MRIILKWGAIFIVSLGLVAAVAVVRLAIYSSSRMNKSYLIEAKAINVQVDAGSLREGERLASIYCAGCHGEDMGGKVFFNNPMIGVINAPNLTNGTGGAALTYRDADWVRSIQHGVTPGGRPLMVMSSKDFAYFSENDLGQIIAYLKSVPTVDHIFLEPEISVMGKVVMSLGLFGEVFNAELIDHDATKIAAPIPAVSAAYGGYLVRTFGCRTCHGEALSGGSSPEPGSPAGPDLTRDGNLGTWTEQVFINTVRNRQSQWMPFSSLQKMTDDELNAIWLYLQSLPSIQVSSN